MTSEVSETNANTNTKGANSMTKNEKIVTAVAAVVIAVSAVVIVASLSGSMSATPEERFISEVRDSVTGIEDTTDRQILALGVTMCDLMETLDESDMRSAGADSGFTMREIDSILAAAKRNIC